MNVHMNSNTQHLFLSLALLTLAAPAWPKVAGSVEKWQPGHSLDMAMAIGLTNDSAPILKQQWEEITKKFARAIDDKQEAAACERMIQEILPAFSWHGYGHRIFFHWGFNTFPRTFDDYKKEVSDKNALVACLVEALETEPEEKRDELKRQVWDRLRNIQSARNRSMMRAIPAPDRDTRNGIATILYDVHLLGDYIDGTEETCKALYPLGKIQGDIINAVNRIRVNDDTVKKKLIKDLKRLSSSNTMYMSKDAVAKRAEQLLNILIEHFPEVVRQSPSYKKLMGT